MADTSTSAEVRRLRVGDRDLARDLFAVMAEVFEEPGEPLSDSYLDALLGRETFWAIVAFSGDEVVGGLTAHTLPMTRAETAEVFIYDVAVRADRQRQGVGRQLVAELCAVASAAGVACVFVPADSTDTHALDFYRALGGVPESVTIFTFPGGQADSCRD